MLTLSITSPNWRSMPTRLSTRTSCRSIAKWQLDALALEIRPAGRERLADLGTLSPSREARGQLCLLNGMHTDNPAHPQATIMMHTGSINFVTPSMGSWIVYGLGTQNQRSAWFRDDQPGGQSWRRTEFRIGLLACRVPGNSSGCRQEADRQHPQLTPPSGRTATALGFAAVDESRRAASVAGPTPNLEGIIESYELAFRMQTAVPELHGSVRRTGECSRAVRNQSTRHCRFRHAMPDGSTTGRSWRALHRNHSSRLGSAQQPADKLPRIACRSINPSLHY